MIGESQIYNGTKSVLLEQKHGEMKNKTQYIMLQFGTDGLAEIVGSYDEPQKQCKANLVKLTDNL